MKSSKERANNRAEFHGAEYRKLILSPIASYVSIPVYLVVRAIGISYHLTLSCPMLLIGNIEKKP